MAITQELNKSWWKHPTRHQLYGHLPRITKTIQARRTRHAEHHWRSRDELISDVLLWTPAYSRENAGRPARTYIQKLCEDTGCSPEDLPEAMNDREKWQERVRDIHAGGTTWWWWWWWLKRDIILSKFVFRRKKEIRVDCLIIVQKFIMDNSLNIPPSIQNDILWMKSISRMVNRSISSTDPLMTSIKVNIHFLSPVTSLSNKTAGSVV